MNHKLKNKSFLLIIFFAIFLTILSLTVFVSAQDTCTGGIINYYNKGDVTIHQSDGTTTASDSCFDSPVNIPDGTTAKQLLQISYDNNFEIPTYQSTGAYLFETSCESQTFNGKTEYDVGETYKCPNGCSDGACAKINPENKPIELPSEINGTEKISLCQGCVLKDKCYPLGYRKDGEYCSGNKIFTSQLEANLTCENNFECSSNLCIDSQCISSSFWQKILNWFVKLFG